MLTRFHLKHASLYAIVLVVMTLWFGGLELRGLYRPDEGRYADIPREMLASGDWITPRLNGLKYFEKPPFQYWMTAAAYQVFGADEWTARLWTALSGFLGLCAMLFAATRLFGAEAGRHAGLVLASMWGYFFASQYLTLDMGLTFFMTIGMLAFVLAHRPHETPEAARRWMLIVWAAMAFAVLSKGLIGVVLPGLVLAVYVGVQRDVTPLIRLRIATGSAIFLVIAAPWFVVMQVNNPEFFDFFFIREHFARFSLPDHHRPGPWWYFLPVLLVMAMPWTPVLPAVLARAWRSPATGRLHVDRFLICWVAVIFVFFSASSSKLPGYILPAIPALALLIARHWSALSLTTRRIPGIALVAAGAILVLAMIVIETDPRLFAVRGLIDIYEIWMGAAAAILVGVGGLAWRMATRTHLTPIVALALGSMLALQVSMLGMHVYDEHYSSEELIERIAGEEKQFSRDVAFYSVLTFDHSVPFYLGRPVTLVKYQGELALGIAAEPSKYVDSLDAFVQRWWEHDNAYAVMAVAEYEALRDRGLPMRIVDRDARRIVVARF